MDHKLLTSAIIISFGGLSYYVVKQKSNRKKRRAKKASNGARLEVVVIAGSPSEPIVRSISLDLERRGFIVYTVCNGIEDEIAVQNEARQDIRPLRLDIVDVSKIFCCCSFIALSWQKVIIYRITMFVNTHILGVRTLPFYSNTTYFVHILRRI
jgi:hypothetical protein